MLIAEDAGKLKQVLKYVHDGYTYTGPTLDTELAFQSKHIIDALHFAEKDESLLLQIADHCAFIVKRKVMNDPHMNEYFRSIFPQITDDYKEARHFRMMVPRSWLIEK